MFQFGNWPLGNSSRSYSLVGNYNIRHEHGFFDNGENVGYGPEGVFGGEKELEDTRYNMFGPYYQDDVMRQALENLLDKGGWEPATPWFSWPSSNDYDVLGNNCQDFSDSLRNEYSRLGGATCSGPFVNGQCGAP